MWDAGVSQRISCSKLIRTLQTLVGIVEGKLDCKRKRRICVFMSSSEETPL